MDREKLGNEKNFRQNDKNCLHGLEQFVSRNVQILLVGTQKEVKNLGEKAYIELPTRCELGKEGGIASLLQAVNVR